MKGAVYDLPSIMASNRGGLYYLEHCRVEAEDGTPVFKQAGDDGFYSYNIPYMNTSFLMLGRGTSITNDAMFLLSRGGVVVCFTGGGGFPLYAGSELSLCIVEPQNEYGPTKYMQRFAKIFFDDDVRLEAAKQMQARRIEATREFWRLLHMNGDLATDPESAEAAMNRFEAESKNAPNTGSLFEAEERFTKSIYAVMSKSYAVESFKRRRDSTEIGDDEYVLAINDRLDQFNYIAYGAAATALHAMGVNSAFSLMHGKTRRGALVFDIADIVKDGLALPLAFHTVACGIGQSDGKKKLVHYFHKKKIIGLLCDRIAQISELGT